MAPAFYCAKIHQIALAAAKPAEASRPTCIPSTEGAASRSSRIKQTESPCKFLHGEASTFSSCLPFWARPWRLSPRESTADSSSAPPRPSRRAARTAAAGMPDKAATAAAARTADTTATAARAAAIDIAPRGLRSRVSIDVQPVEGIKALPALLLGLSGSRRIATIAAGGRFEFASRFFAFAANSTRPRQGTRGARGPRSPDGRRTVIEETTAP